MTMKDKDVPTTEETAEMVELENIIRAKETKAKLEKRSKSEKLDDD